MRFTVFGAVLFLAGFGCFAATTDVQPAATSQPSVATVGERVPSEDTEIRDFHSLGLIGGRVDIFRCSSPVHDLHTIEDAVQKYQHLHDLGIRTVVSLEDPGLADDNGNAAKLKQTKQRFDLETAAAGQTGIKFVNYPMNNSGPNSFETMTDQQVRDWLEMVSGDILERAKIGGVVFHCSAGHDRTGMVAAYIRMKYEHWPVDQAIDEMRRYGHNWKRYSNNGGVSSWQEDHLRAIAKMLEAEASTRPASG
jgi:hypothetical protein